MPSKKEMKKLRRDELLEMLIEQTRQKDELQLKLEEAEKRLGDREIALQEAGTLAEASLQLNAIFQAADHAASQYLENVQGLAERQRAELEKLDTEARQTAERQLREVSERCRALEAETVKKCETLEAETTRKCEAMTAEAKKEADAYWAEVSRRLEKYLEDHDELTEWLLRRRISKDREETP